MYEKKILRQKKFEEKYPKISKNINKYMIPRRCKCSFCGKKFYRYTIHGYESRLANEHDLTCMGFRRARCPFCNCKDKERWLWYVIEKYTDVNKTKGTIMHFAPEYIISKKIKYNKNCVYMSGDIEPGVASQVVDMTDMKFDDSSFDIIIASMVLEHIPDEKKALSELYRTCKQGGKILLTVPQCTDIEETIEDLSIKDPVLRTELYGQDDHVRLYGKDYPERFRKIAFNKCDIKFIRPKDVLSEREIHEMGVQEEYGVFVCTVNKE